MGMAGSRDESPDTGRDHQIATYSPLGMMLSEWGTGKTRGKDKLTMVRYCCNEWVRYAVKGSSVYWPKFGSEDEWMCEALNLWLYQNQKDNVESREYAACWLKGSIEQLVLNEKEFRNKREEEPLVPEPQGWDVLHSLPPPYVPPMPAPIFPSPPIAYPSAPPPPPPIPLEKREENRSGMVTRSQSARLPPPLTVEVEHCYSEQRETPQEEVAEPCDVFLREQENKSKKPEISWMRPLREVPVGEGLGFVNVPLTSTEVRNFKKELTSLIEDPQGCAEQLDQFLGPNIYTIWGSRHRIPSRGTIGTNRFCYQLSPRH
ncbi:uncharacterized protein [Narcine bancroftii]|uniref:uncharacterized protein n=1 Tax=Narcine bancroftii TaxID=1343680 RepID=UPI0038315F84